MTITAETRTADDVAERAFEAVLGTLDLYSIYIGDRLGYYEILSEDGPLTSVELATRAGTDERYVREWLEQQAVTGILDVDDIPKRSYRISGGYAEALTDRHSLSFVAPFIRQVLVSGFKLPAIASAHRSGGGVSWDDFGDEMRESQGDMNRPLLENVLAQEWLPSLPEVAARLVPGATVADIGTGHGWASIGIAKAVPGIEVDGFDVDGPSIEAARRHAKEAGVDDRVTFLEIDAGDPWIEGAYDLVLAIEMIHDLADPVSALSTMRKIAAPDGVVIVADMKVAPEFDPEAGDLERLMYGYSNFVCLPDGKSHTHTAATGTVMRQDTLAAYAREAGFDQIVELPIEADFWRFWKLV